jgi:hypothetical protein
MQRHSRGPASPSLASGVQAGASIGTPASGALALSPQPQE